MPDIKYFETLDWQPLIAGANDSCLFMARDADKTYLAGGGIRGGKLKVNLAYVIEVHPKSK